MTNKPIVLLGEAYGENEAKINAGFVGASGIELLRMLHEAEVIELTSEDREYARRFWDEGKPELIDMIWRMHPEVHRTNVFNLHPPGNNLEHFCASKTAAKEEGIKLISGYPALTKGKFVMKAYEQELERLADELVDLDPNLIVCLGNTGLWALAGKTGVSKLRGTTSLSTHCASGFKLLATYHPAAVVRQWELRPVTVIDLAKAGREAAFPEVRRPVREIWIEPNLADIERFINDHIRGCDILSVDVETSGTRITCIGFAPRPELALVVAFDDPRRKGRCYWPDLDHEVKAWSLIRGVLEDRTIRKCFQNGLYDIAFTLRSYGIRVYNAAEDTMLLHHALQPESLKSLGFLGSVYCDEGAWKTERKGSTTIKRDE